MTSMIAPRRFREIAVLLIADAQTRRQVVFGKRNDPDPKVRQALADIDRDAKARMDAAHELQEYSYGMDGVIPEESQKRPATWQWERLLWPNRYDAPMKPLPWDVEEMGSEGCRIYSVPLTRIQGKNSTVIYPVPKITAIQIVRAMNRTLEEKGDEPADV